MQDRTAERFQILRQRVSLGNAHCHQYQAHDEIEQRLMKVHVQFLFKEKHKL